MYADTAMSCMDTKSISRLVDRRVVSFSSPLIMVALRKYQDLRQVSNDIAHKLRGGRSLGQLVFKGRLLFGGGEVTPNQEIQSRIEVVFAKQRLDRDTAVPQFSLLAITRTG